MANNMELNRRQFMQVFAALGASIALPALPKSTGTISSPTQFFDTPLKNFDYGVIVDGQKIENIQSISLNISLDRDGFVSGDGTRLQKNSYTLAISFFYKFSNELKLKNGFVDLEGSNFLNIEKVKRKWNHFRLKQGDLLISGSASSGIVAEVTRQAAGAVAYTGLIRITSKKMHRQFLKSLLDSKYFNEQVEVQKAGTAMQHYGPTHLKKVVVVIPSDDEQIKIAEYLDKRVSVFNSSIQEIQKSIELLHELKSSLISNVVTGKVKV